MGDISITPRWDFLPAWVRELFASAVGTSVAVGLVICVVGFVIAGVMLIFARSQGMYGMGACGQDPRAGGGGGDHRDRWGGVAGQLVRRQGRIFTPGTSDQGEDIATTVEVGRDIDAAYSPGGAARLVWITGS